ncbi:hypothetical protein EBR56_09370 [bacterium]|nr:hypothetical protein [bacterium]
MVIGSEPAEPCDEAWADGANVLGVPVSDEYATLLCVARLPRPDTSSVVSVTAPVLPATLATDAEIVFPLIEMPLPAVYVPPLLTVQEIVLPSILMPVPAV